jgi:HEPN domain-containing protein
LCQDVIAIHPYLAPLATIGDPLDKDYIPTRYPSGLSGGIPSDAFVAADAEMAISMAEQVLDTVSSKLAP